MALDDVDFGEDELGSDSEEKGLNSEMPALGSNGEEKGLNSEMPALDSDDESCPGRASVSELRRFMDDTPRTENLSAQTTACPNTECPTPSSEAQELQDSAEHDLPRDQDAKLVTPANLVLSPDDVRSIDTAHGGDIEESGVMVGDKQGEESKLCTYCNQVAEKIAFQRINAKKKNFIVCNLCDSKKVALHRQFGAWPPVGFGELAVSQQQEFFRKVQNTPAKNLRTFVTDELTQMRCISEHSKYGGKYLPASVLAKKGYDIANLEGIQDFMEDEVWGRCYRIKTFERWTETAESFVRKQLLTLQERKSKKTCWGIPQMLKPMVHRTRRKRRVNLANRKPRAQARVHQAQVVLPHPAAVRKKER